MHRQTASPRARARSRILVSLVAAMLAAMTLAAGAVPVGAASPKSDKLGKIDHIVVIYEENHSFDNLYGGWEGVNGLANADVAHTTQVAQNGTPYACLKQDDANLTSPPLAADACSVADGDAFDSHFPNTYFTHRRLHPFDRDHVSADAAGVQLPERPARSGDQPGDRACRSRRDRGWVHPGHRPPLLPRAVPARWWQAGSLRHRQRRDRPDDGRVRHEGAADLQVPPRGRSSEVRHRRQLLPGAHSVARSSITSG